MKIRLVNDKENGMVKKILKLQKMFPRRLDYGEWDVWDNLQNPRNINLVLEDESGIIGYLLAIPQDEAVRYLHKDDPLIKIDTEMYYVDQVVVLPDKRVRGSFKNLIKDLVEEVKRKGIKKLSSHLVTEGGFNRLISAMFAGKVISKRMVNLPSYGEHILEYIEVSLE